MSDVTLPSTIHLRQELMELLDPLDVTLKTVAALRDQEFLRIDYNFYGKSEVREAIICRELPWRPVATLLNPDYRKTEEEEPKYGYTPYLMVDEGDNWFERGTSDFSNKYYLKFKEKKYYNFTGDVPLTQRVADELEGGIIRVDLGYDETDGVGFYMMSAKGLKMLRANDRQLYEALTCLDDGSVDKDFEIVETLETVPDDMDIFPEQKEKGTVSVDNYYYWTFAYHQEFRLDTYGNFKETWKAKRRIQSRADHHPHGGNDRPGLLKDMIYCHLLAHVRGADIL